MKKETVQHNANYARGGKDHMAPKQAAGPAKPGHSGHAIKGSVPGAKAAKGGPKTRTIPLSSAARPGHTGRVR
jgi:hypothetical protein